MYYNPIKVGIGRYVTNFFAADQIYQDVSDVYKRFTEGEKIFNEYARVLYYSMFRT